MVTRLQYKLLNRLCRLLRRADWRIDKKDTIVQLIVLTDLELCDAGLDLNPRPLDWYAAL